MPAISINTNADVTFAKVPTHALGQAEGTCRRTFVMISRASRVGEPGHFLTDLHTRMA